MEASLCFAQAGNVSQKKWPWGLIIPVQDPTPFSPFAPDQWPRSLVQLKIWGYSALELAITDPTKLEAREVGHLLEREQVHLAAITTGQAAWKEGLSLSALNERIREKAVARVKAHMEFARYFDAVVIIGLLRGKNGSTELLKESLRECAQFLPTVKLALEPLNRYETSLINTVGEALDFIDAVGQENLGILFDSFHANIEEVSLGEALRAAKDRLFHVHLADSNRWIPGFGHLNFALLWEALEDVSYQGSLVLECFPRPAPVNLFAEKVKKQVKML